MDAMSPAVPQPTNVMRCRSFRPKNLAILDPMADPLMTTGASGPAEPPLAMVKKLATSLEKVERNRKSPPRLDTAYITSGTPCPAPSRTTLSRNKKEPSAPMPGKINAQRSEERRVGK